MMLLLDVDGTLVDSSKRHAILLRKLLEGHKALTDKYSDKSYLEFKRNGNSTKNYCMDVLGLNADLSSQISSEWIAQIEEENLISTDILYSDAIPFLEFAKNEFDDLIMLSARQNENTLINELKSLLIYDFADRIIVVNPQNSIKHKCKIMAEIHKTHEFILIGDSEAEYNAGKFCRVETFILNRGFRSKEYWDQRNEVSYLSLEEIQEIFLKRR